MNCIHLRARHILRLNSCSLLLKIFIAICALGTSLGCLGSLFLAFTTPTAPNAPCPVSVHYQSLLLTPFLTILEHVPRMRTNSKSDGRNGGGFPDSITVSTEYDIGDRLLPYSPRISIRLPI